MIKKFATSINCMDGRVQEPVIRYMKDSFNVDYVDMITEPGPNKILSENKDIDIIEFLKEKVGISVQKHGSKVIAVVGHFDCAGNLETEDVQKEHLKKSVDVISSWNFEVDKVLALWLDKDFNPSLVS